MKRKTLFFFSILAPIVAYSQLSYLPDYSWGGKIGGTGFDNAGHVTTDLYGDVIVDGRFSGACDFDISSAVNSVSSTGSTDAFIAKYSQSGSLKWIKSFTSNTPMEDAPYINSSVTDSSGNIYITGHFNGSADFDPSPTGTKILTSNGDADIFIAKYDRNGILVWAGNIGGAEYDRGFGITIDSQDRLYVTGSFRTTADFDITSGVFNMSSEYIDASFIIKMNKDGQIIWGKATQGMGSDVGKSVAVDSSFNVFVSGDNMGTNDFDPSPNGVFNLTSTFSGQAYLLKLDSDGNFVNAGVTIAPPSTTQSNLARTQKLKIDNNNNVIVTGTFYGTADFNFGSADNSMTSYGIYGMNDAFVLKVDNNLNYLWATKLGVQFADGANGLAIDQNNNILTTGYFEGIIVNDYSGRYGEEVFVWALDPAGNQIDLEDYIGPGSGDIGNDITVDKAGNIYVCGIFDTRLKDANVFDYQSYGNNREGFIVKLGSTQVTQPAIVPPTAVQDSFSPIGSSPFILNVLANDQGLSGTPLIKIVSSPLNGILNVNSGSVTYTPNGSSWMNDSFSYTVENGNGLVSNVAKVDLINGNLNVQEADLSRQVKLYPNPAHTTLSVISDSEILSAEVFDLSGKKLLEVKGTYPIDVSSLSTGNYILHAKSKNGKIIRQTFIKK
ncbi:SBBP repeat-containing protein [Chryseobacterium profundimaris]|uniref:Por secretion system C-terminal sorting domain-containing protein n=1 Tax=Chryseobacterium profundimaris TaxID=1387275 RepID=A0ABY1P4R5_9FLAO|nr:SBBP repeat-containing protein [Chryseobacterium profundimaris]SMP25924.1 Por secretion system C-terminal sorting domain-containing protein [Chryseobacterium profundimaris]